MNVLDMGAVQGDSYVNLDMGTVYILYVGLGEDNVTHVKDAKRIFLFEISSF